jgi:hypothetical protein
MNREEDGRSTSRILCESNEALRLSCNLRYGEDVSHEEARGVEKMSEEDLLSKNTRDSESVYPLYRSLTEMTS